jgi:hypothetical protein
MAKAIDFSERNDYLGKPPDLSDNQCYSLPICRFVTKMPGESDTDAPVNAIAHVSCWKLSEEEREEVSRTGVVYLKILGTTTFPVSIHGLTPIYLESGELSDRILTDDEIKKMRGQ